MASSSTARCTRSTRFSGDAMRTAFHEQLDSLTEMLSNMCGLVGLAMDRATQGLLNAELSMAE